MKVDLHTHTTCSDGTLTPKDLVFYAKEKGLEAIAVTDHDCLRGVAEAEKYAKELNIHLIKGLEFAILYKEKEIHIVGLFVDTNDKTFLNIVDEIETGRYERNAEMVRRFNKLNIPMTMEDLNQGDPYKIITRSHFAEYLLENNHVDDKDTAFELYLRDGCETYLAREYYNAKEVIEIIHNAGGIAILAHANFYGFDFNGIREMMTEFTSVGLDGVEGYYPTYTEEEGEFIRTVAKELNLTLSGGSDYHGDTKPGLDLYTGFDNTLVLPENLLENILEKHNYSLK